MDTKPTAVSCLNPAESLTPLFSVGVPQNSDVMLTYLGSSLGDMLLGVHPCCGCIDWEHMCISETLRADNGLRPVSTQMLTIWHPSMQWGVGATQTQSLQFAF